MRVVIIGAGDAGRRLAARLCGEKHDVVLVDARAEPLEEIASDIDVQTVRGNGTSPRVLNEAGVAKAGLVAAVTDRDEVNILAAMFAHSAGAVHTAVRVSNDEWSSPAQRELMTKLGIDLVINEHDECAHEVLSVLKVGGAKELVRLAGGRIWAVGIDLPPGSPLLDGPLKEFTHPEVLSAVRLIAVMRDGKLLMPHGEVKFEVNDAIYFVGLPKDIGAFLDIVRPEQPPIRKVVIAGGGELGLRLAGGLETTDKQVVLIEGDDDRAQYCSSELNSCTVIRGNALNRLVLEEVGITPQTAVVAATGDDENNIIECLLAQKLGAVFGVALISKPEYVPIINEARLLGRAVSPYLSTINAVLRFVRGSGIRAATLLQNVPGELVEMQIAPGSRWAGRTLRNARLPRRAVVALVVRGNAVAVATGDTVLRAGDRLIVFAPLGAATRLESVFRK